MVGLMSNKSKKSFSIQFLDRKTRFHTRFFGEKLDFLFEKLGLTLKTQFFGKTRQKAGFSIDKKQGFSVKKTFILVISFMFIEI